MIESILHITYHILSVGAAGFIGYVIGQMRQQRLETIEGMDDMALGEIMDYVEERLLGDIAYRPYWNIGIVLSYDDVDDTND